MALDDKQAQALIDAAMGGNGEQTEEGAAAAQAAGGADDKDESSLYDWSDTFGDDDEGGGEAAAADEKQEKQDPEKKPDASDKKEWWQEAAAELGLEASSKEDFIEKTKPREVYVNDKDPVVRRLKSYTSMDDEALVREDKKASGWEASKIDRYIEKNKDNLEFMAEDIRSTLNQKINEHSQQQEMAARDAQAKQAAVRDKLNQEVKNHLSKTQEVLGFKVGKDDAATTKWRTGMEKYLTGGGVFKEIDAIVKDASEGKPERLVELAQFLKGRDGILKGLMQKGRSQEAEKFLRDLENSGGDTGKKGERVETGKEKNLDAWVV